MYLNKLQLYLQASRAFRQTGKDDMVRELARWQRYSFMVTEAPILPIYPRLQLHTFKVEVVKPGSLNLVTTLDFGHGGFNILTPTIPIVNVGTIGHVDWPLKDHQKGFKQ